MIGDAFDGRILAVTPDDYHAIDAFSSTVAKTLISRSPAHAKANMGKRATAAMERGTVIHRLVLGKGKDFAVAQPHESDYRTTAGKAFRDKAVADGKVPVKSGEFVSWGSAATAILTEFANRGIALDGASELAIAWKEETPHGVVECKGMLDHCWLEQGRILDLKITENAASHAIEKTSEAFGYAIQHAAYTRGLSAVQPQLLGRIEMLFAFAEPEHPYPVNLCRADGVFRELGERRWLRAVNTWAKCSSEGKWPAYGDDINFLSAPLWAVEKEEAA